MKALYLTSGRDLVVVGIDALWAHICLAFQQKSSIDCLIWGQQRDRRIVPGTGFWLGMLPLSQFFATSSILILGKCVLVALLVVTNISCLKVLQRRGEPWPFDSHC